MHVNVRHSIAHCCSGVFGVGQRNNHKHTRVVVGNTHARCAVHKILARPRLRLRPPAAMRDWHQRTQRHVHLASIPHLLSDPDERARSSRFVPDLACHHFAEPFDARCTQAIEIQRLGLVEHSPHGAGEPELIGNLRGRYKTRRPLVSVRGKRRGALECGARDRDRAAPPSRARMVFECSGDFLVESVGRHRPMPEPPLGIGDDCRKRGVRRLDFAPSSGLSYGGADQRMAEAHTTFDNFDQADVHRGVQPLAWRGTWFRRPYTLRDFAEGGSAVQRSYEQRGSRHRRKIFELGGECLLQACGERRRHRSNTVMVRRRVRCGAGEFDQCKGVASGLAQDARAKDRV